MKLTALLALMLLAPASLAQGAWKDGEGKPVPDTEWQKSVAGFGGMLIVTPDQDWEKKWNTPTDGGPHFSTAGKVKRGGELTILMIFTNPLADDAGESNVSVDVDVARPDGSSSTHAQDVVCFKGKLLGPPTNVYLCGPTVGFVGEPSDPTGTWSVKITMTDEVRKVSIPLATSFELVE
jgi:hypothetical protein